jgi:hypothetical protein
MFQIENGAIFFGAEALFNGVDEVVSLRETSDGGAFLNIGPQTESAVISLGAVAAGGFGWEGDAAGAAGGARRTVCVGGGR